MNEVEKTILEKLKYDPKTGIITWAVSSTGWVQKGKEAGSKKGGYRYVRVAGKPFYAHRLAWFMHYGHWPLVIDHINGVRDDNRIENLRDVSPLENTKNSSKSKSNKSGHSGVYFQEKTKRWIAVIGHKGRNIRLGTHEDMEVAIKIRNAALEAYGYHENHCKK